MWRVGGFFIIGVLAAFESRAIDSRNVDAGIEACEKKAEIVLREGHYALTMNVITRSRGEKLFRAEAQAIAIAAPDDLVPIEWMIHPFYSAFDDHTSLRIGKSLFHFATQGWRRHQGGSDSADTFIFYNRFFRDQIERRQRLKLPNYSIGVKWLVPRLQADAIAEIIARREAAGERFDLFSHNCNQAMIEVLLEAGVKMMADFPGANLSSRSFFRRLLNRNSLSIREVNVYPLPGSETDARDLQHRFPRYLLDDSDDFEAPWQRYRLYWEPLLKGHWTKPRPRPR